MLRDAERRVKALAHLDPEAPLVSAPYWRIVDPAATKDPDEAWRTMTEEEKQHWRVLDGQRRSQIELLLGNGMKDTVSRVVESQTDDADGMEVDRYRVLPFDAEDFLQDCDENFANAVINMSLVEDRDALRQYLAYAPWGIGIALAVSIRTHLTE